MTIDQRFVRLARRQRLIEIRITLRRLWSEVGGLDSAYPMPLLAKSIISLSNEANELLKQPMHL